MSQPRCVCSGGHVDGLARSTRKTKGEYWVEPSCRTAKHLDNACRHSTLQNTTNQSITSKYLMRVRRLLALYAKT